MLDPPKHGPVRRVASARFTPRAVRERQADIERIAVEILDDAAPAQHLGRARLRRSDRRAVPARGDRVGARRTARRLGALVPLDQRGHRQGRSGVPPPGRDAGCDEQAGARRAARVLPEPDRAAPRRSARRPRERADQGRGRREAAHRGATRLVLRAARRGGQRDHAQRDQRRAARVFRAPRRVGEAAGAARAAARRGRGDPAVGQPDQPLHPHCDRGLRAARRDDSRRRAGRALLRFGES